MISTLKSRLRTFLAALVLIGVAGASGAIAQPTALLQVIHNAADPAARVVDVYVGGQLAIDDFTFRHASNILPVPAGVPGIEVAVAPGNSTSVDDAIWTTELPALEGGTGYIAVASGVLDPSAFAGNSDGDAAASAFDIFIYEGLRQTASSPTNVAMQIFHGSTDAPKVDVLVAGTDIKLADGISYGQFLDEYAEVPAGSYTINVTPAGDPNTVVAAYTAPLSTAAGFATTVVASGFLNPATNQNGPAFGLFAVIQPGAPLLELPTFATTPVQIIHNSPDPIASVVDIYINGQRAISSFRFRDATPFIDLPAGMPIEIGIAPGESTTADDIAIRQVVTFEEGKPYIVAAVGLVGEGFVANPEGIETNFRLQVLTDDAVTVDTEDFTLLVGHFVPDAPAVNIVARGVGTLVEDLSFGQVAESYLVVPLDDYILDIVLASDPSVVVSSYVVPGSQIEDNDGTTAVILASGFLRPEANNASFDAAFGLLAVSVDGETIMLPEEGDEDGALVQIIHNSADPLAAVVDIYVDGELAIPGFTYRAALPFIPFPADTDIEIGIALGTNTTADDIAYRQTVRFEDGKSYIVAATGVVGEGFAPNPDGRDISFRLEVLTDEAIVESDETVDIIIHHGVTDAPAVDVSIRGIGTVLENVAFGETSEYLSVEPGRYVVDLLLSSDPSIVVGSWRVDADIPLSAAILASGFLDPEGNGSNSVDAGFGLLGALSFGFADMLPVEGEEEGIAIVQVIHNSADPAAALVDVYVNGEIFARNFAFRTATEQLELPLNEVIEIAIAPPNSTSEDDAIARFGFEMGVPGFYVLMANGVLNPGSFAMNPSDRDIAFNLEMLFAPEGFVTEDLFNFVVIHGSTDAPDVGVDVRGIGTLIDNFGYGDIDGIFSVPPASYTLDIVLDEAGERTPIAAYIANATGIDDGVRVVFASGFLNPAANQNGAAFGLWMVGPEGGNAVPLEATTSVRDNVTATGAPVIANFPNPFTETTVVSYLLEKTADVVFHVTDNMGRTIQRIDKGVQAAGTYNMSLNAASWAPGTYFLTMRNGERMTTHRFVVVK